MQDTSQVPTIVKTVATLAPIVSGGLAGALLTYVLKTRSEKRQQKIININITDVPLSPQSIEVADVLPADSLKVSFENKTFNYLRLYTAFLQNVGYRGVEGMKLALTFPKDTTQIRTIISSEPLSIPCTLESAVNDDTEIIYSIGRLEVKDKVRLSFLIDTKKSKEIKCLPRGVDDVKFQISKDEYLASRQETVVSPSFKVVFLSIASLTIFSFLIALVIAVAAPPTEDYVRLMETLSATYKLGFGAILGLLGSKSL